MHNQILFFNPWESQPISASTDLETLENVVVVFENNPYSSDLQVEDAGVYMTSLLILLAISLDFATHELLVGADRLADYIVTAAGAGKFDGESVIDSCVNLSFAVADDFVIKNMDAFLALLEKSEAGEISSPLLSFIAAKTLEQKKNFLYSASVFAGHVIVAMKKLGIHNLKDLPNGGSSSKT